MVTLIIENRTGGGPADYSRYLLEPAQFFTAELNKPQYFSFELQDLSDPLFVVPTRGSYVQFEDTRWESRSDGIPDGVLFTGYVTDDPQPEFLGVNNGQDVWKYRIQCTSDDYLPQIKEFPQKLYVNKRRGFIIRDLVAQMFENAAFMPLDTSGVQDGGIERLFQVDKTKKFADVLADFAKADAFRYYTLHGKLFYEPEAELWPNDTDPERKLTIDALDPRFTPQNLQMERVATQIANDVTVYGEEEPRELVRERYVSDGYNGEHQLLYPPYGVVEKVLIDDDFTAPQLDSGLWEEQDDPMALTGLGDGSYIQMFEGALNIVGGPGEAFGTNFAFIRSRRGIELSGIIEFRDCELYFPPSPTGVGVIGGLYREDSVISQNMFCGWRLDLSGPGPYGSIWPYINNAIVPESGFALNFTHHYILRRTFEFDTPVGPPVIRRGPVGTDVTFGDVEYVNGCFVRYEIEDIDSTDPQNVITTKHTIYTARIDNCPDFVLYVPINTFSLHCVMNFCKVYRPQQVKVTVNDIPIRLGDFIDGGLATISREDNRAKLQWYSVATGATPPPDVVVTPSGPFAFWKLGDASDHLIDSGDTGSYPMRADPGITVVPGAPSSTVDNARHFPGRINPPSLPSPAVRGPAPGSGFFTGGMPVPFSITGWVRTSEANGGIFLYAGQLYGYCALVVANGRLQAKIEFPEAAINGNIAINDGQWHHFAWTFSGTETNLYVDGQLDATGAQTYTSPQIALPWVLGYDNCLWPSLGNIFIDTYLLGDLDEVAIHSSVLTATMIQDLFRSTQTPGQPAPSPGWNPQTGVTIPPQGSIVEITYYRADKARARVRSLTSIVNEQARFGDDGVRQLTVMPDEVFPTPRTSAECQYLAQAILADRAEHRYEGSYYFETGERDVTNLRYFPMPGDMLPIDRTLPDGERIDRNVLVTKVSSEFIGDGAYGITVDFGHKNRFDEAQRKLLLQRKSSLDNPEIRDKDVLTAEILDSTGYSVPLDITDMVVTNVTPLTFTVDMNPARPREAGGYGGGGGSEVNGSLPSNVVGYEVRRDNTGWGQPNYVARTASAVLTLNRGTRDRAYFVRPFNASNVYSRNSAIIRVIAPLSNTLVATGLDGDISSQHIRLFIPLTRNPDIGGFMVQKDNADGVVLYVGDGITHRSIVSGATVLVESNQITLTIPNTSGAGAFTVRVLVYNLVNEFGPETFFTINRPATEP